MIELKNVTKIYGKKKNQFVALNDVSLRIPTGVSVAILGKSGSGKSTLMHAISGLDRPQQGEVIIDGQDILKLKQKQVDEFRARKIGFIFQSFFVQGNESVADNVSLPLEIVKMPRGLRESKINEALKAVDLYEKRKNRAKDLSGARAIVGSPQIIFADEPTGNLDSETGAKVEELLFNYNKQEGATLIIVTHDVDLAKKCDYQILIKDGKIKGSNIPKEGKSGR